ncbi:hypothetical protein AO353_17315 [Pseudomonas fluorescens]|uniref:Uncharacterized protein n=1 Tax=Pseudomonas fluorescens TaxID=294 RepID=A0A0N9WKJ7_PSEFL|nr:hypothetical protein AO353_17315 [Pseudomonas fluorescens]
MTLEGKADGVSSSMTSLRQTIESVRLLSVSVIISLCAGASMLDNVLVVLVVEVSPAVSVGAMLMLFH